MRIKKIEVGCLKAPLIQPFRIAIGQHDHLDNLLVKVQLENGTIGFGEAAIASHITGETVEQTRENLEAAAECLPQHSSMDYLRLSMWLHDSFPANKSAVAAVEMAILDALTKQMNIPLWRMFGSKPTLLKTDITIVIADLEETKKKAEEFYKQGFRSFKIKVGKDMDLDFHRVQAVSRIARRAQLLLDANQGYDAKQALAFLKNLAKARIKVDLIEQPVPKGDWEGLKKVTKLSKIPVCADESASSISDVIRLIKDKTVRAVNIKLMKTGLIHGFEIARLAKANQLKVMIGGMMESNVAMTAAAHLAAGMGDFDFIDLDTPFFIKNEVSRNPYLSTNGIYDLSKVKAGIGIKPSL